MKQFFIRFTCLFLCGLALLSLSSCGGDKSDDPKPVTTPSLSVTPQSVTPFGSDGGTFKLSVSANGSWEAVIDGNIREWVSVSPSSGEAGSQNVTITVSKNTTDADRSGSIVFKSGTLTKSVSVSQSQNNVMEIGQKSYTVPAEASKLEIAVKTNVDLDVTASESWVHISSSRAVQSKTITLSIDENSAGKERKAAVTIKGKNLTETVTITQSVGLSVSEESIPSFSSDGGSHTLTLSAGSKWEAVVGDDLKDWISVNPQSGDAGSHTITVTAAKNATGVDRSGNVVFKSGSITKSVSVSQSQNNVMEIGQKSYTVPAEASKLEIAVKTNVDLDVTASESWVHISSSRAVQSKTVTLSIDENSTGKERKATVTIKGKNLTETVTITQSANTSAGGGIEDMPIEKL